MREILTPDEIAALTAAYAADAPSTPRAAPSGVRPVDLTNQERSLEGRMPGLELVLGRFARGLRTVFATCFGDVPSVQTASVGLVRFARMASRLAEPAGLVRFRMSPLRGQGILTIPSPLVASLLQVSCGGAPGQGAVLPVREFSPIELRMLERLAVRVLAELHAAWEPIAAVDVALAQVETSPLFAAVATPEELVVHAEMTVVVAGVAPSTLSVVVPNAALDPIRLRLQTVRAAAADTTAPSARWTADMRARLLDVPVEVSVELGSTELMLSRLLELAVGDVLGLDGGPDAPVVVRVAGERRLSGAPGVQSGSNAVRIDGWV